MTATDEIAAAREGQAAGPAASRTGAPAEAGPAAGQSAWARRVALAAVLTCSAFVNTHKLAQNGYANTFYSASVRSMLTSLHNFVFVSFDPGGLVTIDKPPLAVWLQVASAKVFGLSPLSLLLPEAIVSTLAVAALYRAVVPRLGAVAALCSALVLAVFPSFVAVSRDNGVDPLLILLMVLACWAALASIERGRWRELIACAVLVGLAFNTKTLAAYLVVPGIALGYLVCAPGTHAARLGRLLVAGAVMLLVSFAWIALVELTPASQRPYVGSSTNNSELGLTFEYNGVGRVKGETGGPGNVPEAADAGGAVPAPGPRGRRGSAAHVRSRAETLVQPPVVLARFTADGRRREALYFAEPPSLLRLLRPGLADEGGWLLPFSLVGLIALALTSLIGERSRRRPRLATTIVFGGWLSAEAVILSLSKGIVHPYYVSAMGPGLAVMVGGGAAALVWLARTRHRGGLLVLLAAGLTVAAQISIFNEQEFMRWMTPVLIVAAVAGVCAMLWPHRAAAGMVLLLGVLLLAPAVYSYDTSIAPVEGTFPAPGPRETPGLGGVGLDAADLRVDQALIAYVRSHRPTARWALLTDSAPTAAPLILLGLRAGALGGYSGTDPAVSAARLSRLVSAGEARYVVLGGEYSTRGGNGATRAAALACRLVPWFVWHGAEPFSEEALALYDCAGRASALARS